MEVDGIVVAESSWSAHLFETLLPPRYYVPRTSVVDWGLLEPSATRSLCPYKGEAKYFDVIVNGDRKKDIVWYYETSPPDTAAMQNMVCRITAATSGRANMSQLCFYNEKVDIFIDGVKQERPKSKFS